MKKQLLCLIATAGLLMAFVPGIAQQLNVAVVKISTNKLQITGTATAPGFTAAPNNFWASMNLTWRIPKTATSPAPTVAPPSTTPEVTEEASLFTGASPRDAFNGGLDLTMFDLTAFGQPDDGFWYFQVTGTTEAVQNIATGASIVLYEFSLPITWGCGACVELLTADVPGLPISTTSFIDNAGTGTDVLQVSANNAPLPVSWLYIKADAKENQSIDVSWATAMEQNNAGFEVERSEDGQRFVSITSMPGKGNSITASHYSINDAQVIPGVKYFYRIKQTDLDGRVRHSSTVYAMIPGDLFVVHVKPNPVKETLNILLQSSKKQQVRVLITDMTGRLYLAEQQFLIEAGTTRFNRNVSQYPAGTYVAKVITADGAVRTVKFIVE
jgi:hypothetical protein